MERDEDPRGVALSHYLDAHEGVDVLLICNGCSKHTVLPMGKVIERLEARGLNARAVGIREIAGMVDRPCERCGKVDYETRPGWPIGRGQGVRLE